MSGMSLTLFAPHPEEWIDRLPLSARKEMSSKDAAAWEAYCGKREAFRNARAFNCGMLAALEDAWVRTLRARDTAAQDRIEAFVRAAWVSRDVTARHPFGDVIAWWHRRRTWHADRRCPKPIPLPTPPPDPRDYIGEPGPCAWCAIERPTALRPLRGGLAAPVRDTLAAMRRDAEAAPPKETE